LDDQQGIQFLYPGGSDLIRPLAVSASPATGPKRMLVSFSNLEGQSDTRWDFGDGLTATGALVQHRFLTYGTYTVNATSNGRSNTVVIEVEKAKRKLRLSLTKRKR
jgi:hypothetical protein